MIDQMALSARKVIEAVLPDARLRWLVMDRLLRSWELAGTIAPLARSVSLASNGFRLNIGQVEALTFFDGTIRVLLAVSHDDARLALQPIGRTEYRSFRGPQCVFIGSVPDYEAAEQLIEPFHAAYIHGAATTADGSPRQGSPHVGHHSRELITYAENFASAVASHQKQLSPYPFNVGAEYTRRDVFAVLGIPEGTTGGPWFTGYASYGPDWFVFCGVGTGGRTGHDYNNRFLGDNLIWFAKNGSRLQQSSIQGLLSPVGQVYLFYRENDRDPFTFAGLAHPVQAFDVTPVKIVWRFRSTNSNRQDYSLPEDVFRHGIRTPFRGDRHPIGTPG
ncbi:DUF3427 domain-containing protein [Bradyrhizobium sp. 26S5]|uniref:DUF3427 domain-containing protein n=1 Tax=Bradyrhizobium sp. 26S5 TaxID=3139729 RepID=UPI0030D39CA3